MAYSIVRFPSVSKYNSLRCKYALLYPSVYKLHAVHLQ